MGEEEESTVEAAEQLRDSMLREAGALRHIYIGQNALLDRIASNLDKLFPPEEYGKGHGTGHTAPGDIVRAYIVDIDKTLMGVYGVDGTEVPNVRR